MNAVRFYECGGPEVLQLEEIPNPEPGDDEVLVRVRACGVNHFDIDVRDGVSRWPLPLPHQLGIEFAGNVAAVGRGVTSVQEGQRVWVLHEIPCMHCEYCLAGLDNLCLNAEMYGVQRPGGYAEYVVAPARAVLPLADSVSYDAAAAGQVVFTTAWHMLVERGKVKAGETVLISAAGSGIGHAAIQIAKLAGATVITTAGSDEKLARAREDGADHVINYRTEDVTNRALELNSGRGVDIVIEHVGGEQFTACLNALKKRGRLITCGGHAGEVVGFDIIPFFRMEWEVLGSRTGTVRETNLVFALMAEGKLRPRIHAALPLSGAPEAHRILEQRLQSGKVVLQP
jgi:NADPH:quinone reductase-like Zn-dependent oxidoreductase